MKFKLFSAILASFIIGQSAEAEPGRWQTHYNSPISTFETKKWRVSDVNVVVMGTSKDVSWYGSRTPKALNLIQNIVSDAVQMGSQKLRGRRDVVLNVAIYDFKTPTQAVMRSDRTDLGVHNITLSLDVVDSKTNQLILPPTMLEADLEALIGTFGLAFVAQRQDPRARTTQHIASVVQGFLGQGPDPRRQFKRYDK